MYFNYFLLCSTGEFKAVKKIKISLDSYDDNGNCLFKGKRKKRICFFM